MILLFVRDKVDSDAFIKYGYEQYRNLMFGLCLDLPEEVEIIREKSQKPRFNVDFVHFNLAHTDGVTMLALSDTEIGVDVEKIRPYKKDFSRFGITADSDEEFFEKWTEKESYLKMTGEGLKGIKKPIPSFVHFEHFEPFPGYHACICAVEQNIYAYEVDPQALK